jgi:hypothetical protein
MSSGQTVGFGTDPAQDHTNTSDNGIAGVVIGGNVPELANIPFTYITSPLMDLASVPGSVYLEFWRVLNSDFPPYMDSSVQVFNGSTWVTLYSVPPMGPIVADMAWTKVTYNVTAYKNAFFRVRFGYTVLDYTMVFTCGGWNIDDIRLVPAQNCP